MVCNSRRILKMLFTRWKKIRKHNKLTYMNSLWVYYQGNIILNNKYYFLRRSLQNLRKNPLRNVSWYWYWTVSYEQMTVFERCRNNYPLCKVKYIFDVVQYWTTTVLFAWYYTPSTTIVNVNNSCKALYIRIVVRTILMLQFVNDVLL